jgi:VWFA-related protein
VRGRLWIALLGTALASVSGAGAQSSDTFEIRKVERLHLDDVYPGPEGERVVDLYLRALTRYREPVENLRPIDLVVRDDDERIDPDDLMLWSLKDTGRGMACVVAIDTSRTMKGEPFKRARAAALEFLELLESRDRVAIVAFSDEVRVVASFSASRAEARVELERLEIDSESLSTVLYDGVYKSVELIRLGDGLPRRSFAILFSDGKDAGSHRSLEQVMEFSQGSELRPPTLIFTIGYARFGGEGLEILKRLSKETGGDFLRAESTIHLTTFFNEIWRQMKHSYVVRYAGDMDGAPHTVEVSIEGQSDSRTVGYPKIRGPVWPYLAVLLLAVLVAALAWLLSRGRSGGRLVFVGGPRAGEVVPLTRSKTRIGALPDNDVVIPLETISRYHAAIHRKGRQVEIEDLNSRNGTFVNDSAIRTLPLQPGDKIRLADVDLVYER